MEKMKEEICSQCRHCFSCFCGDEFEDCKLKNMQEEPPTEYVELRNQVRFYRKMAQQLEKENKRLKSHIEWLEKRPSQEDALKSARALGALEARFDNSFRKAFVIKEKMEKKLKKIMFNDKYGLTKAVLEGRKTQTRRIVDVSKLSKMQIDCLDDENSDLGILTMCNLLDDSRYKVGEEVAVAQSYKEVCYSPSVQETIENELGMSVEDSAGHNNKMFVRADLMPHRIKITNIRIEHLQDISEDDCLKEGVYYHTEPPKHHEYDRYSPWSPSVKPYKFESEKYFRSAKYAFKHLIEKVSGKGTWDSNPWVFVYDFELIKNKHYGNRKKSKSVHE